MMKHNNWNDILSALLRITRKHWELEDKRNTPRFPANAPTAKQGADLSDHLLQS